MYGAILGDIIGSSYEFRPCKRKDFLLFTEASRYTDDTVMTLAVARAFLDLLAEGRDADQAGARLGGGGELEGGPSLGLASQEGPTCRPKLPSPDRVQEALTRRMREYGLRHLDAGYGGGFSRWLQDPEAGPYHSFGNGSAMRVSSVAWLFDDIDLVSQAARLSAAVTHNHPEGVKGAEAVASCIFLARQGVSKAGIKHYVTEAFDYDLDRTLAEIRPGYSFDVTCQGSVPEAILAFLEGRDFEDCIRNAISLGGDADTQAAIAGSIAEAYYGLPEVLVKHIQTYLPEDLLEVAADFQTQKLPNDHFNHLSIK